MNYNIFKSAPVIISLLMVFIFLIDSFYGHSFTYNYGGVIPRTTSGLDGIFISTLFHTNLSHITNNLIGFAILSILLMFTLNNKEFYIMWVFISILSGGLVWLFGSSGIHIGASSVIFGMWSLLITLAILNKSLKDILISLLVFLIFGFSFFAGMVPKEGVSFEGHIFGAISGVIFARIYVKNLKYIKLEYKGNKNERT